MNTASRHNEYRLFLSAQREAIDAIKSGDQRTIHDEMLNVEAVAKFTEWPRLRQAVADFLRLHAEHMPTRDERDAYELEGLRLDIEDFNDEPDAEWAAYNVIAMRVNLSSVEDIWRRTKVVSIREEAAALLRKYAAHAQFYTFTA